MPHCIIEYSIDLEDKKQITDTVKIVNNAIENSGLFNKKAIRTRAIPISTYLVGGIEQSFMHLTVKIMEGRTDSQKKELSDLVLKSVITKCNIKNISVEIFDLNKNGYFLRE